VNAIKSVVVPDLDHDAMMLNRFGTKVSPNGRMERRIVANLIAHLGRAGFKPTGVFDGEEFNAVSGAKSAMEFIFNLDEASLRFAPVAAKHLSHKEQHRYFDQREHGVLLTLGEGVDIICDWNYNEHDVDGFNAAMDSFDVEAFA